MPSTADPAVNPAHGLPLGFAAISSIFTIMVFLYVALRRRSILRVTLFFILYDGFLLILLHSHGSHDGERLTDRNAHVRALSKRAVVERSLFCPD
jgi:hypothetical protein